jgi:hypothetical protein
MTVQELIDELKELADKGYEEAEVLFETVEMIQEPFEAGFLTANKYYVVFG